MRILDKFKFINSPNLLFFNQLIISGTNFSVAVILSRILGPELFGNFSLLWLVPLFLISIQQSMITSPLYALGVKVQNDKLNAYISSFFWITICLLIFFILTSLIFSSIIKKFSYFEFLDQFHFLIILCSCLYILQDFFKRILVFQKKYFMSLKLDVLAYGSYLFLTIICTYYDSISILNILQIFSISFLFSSVYGFFSMKVVFSNFAYFKKIFMININYSKWLVLSNVVQWGGGNFFLILTTTILGSSFLGGLRIIQNFFGLFNVIFAALDNIFPIQFARLYNQKEFKKLNVYILKILSIGVLVTILVILVYPLMKEIIIFIFSEKYVDFIYIYIWFAIITFFIYLNKVLVYLLRSVDFTLPILISYFTNFIFSLSSANFLIQTLKIDGTCLGLLIIQINMTVIILISIKFFKNDSTCYFRKVKAK